MQPRLSRGKKHFRPEQWNSDVTDAADPCRLTSPLTSNSTAGESRCTVTSLLGVAAGPVFSHAVCGQISPTEGSKTTSFWPGSPLISRTQIYRVVMVSFTEFWRFCFSFLIDFN